MLKLGSFGYYFSVFRSYTGWSFYLFIVLSLIATLLESLGIASVVPLLTLNSKVDSQDYISRILTTILDFFNLEKTFSSLIIFIVIVFFLKSVFYLFQEVSRLYIINSFLRELKTYFAVEYSKMKYSYFVNTTTGYFNNIVNKECDTTIGSFRRYSEVVVALCSAMVFLSMSLAINLYFTIIIISAGATVHFLFKKIRILSSGFSFELANSNAKIQDFFIQFIHYFKYLKSTGNAATVSASLTNEIKVNTRLMFSTQLLNAFTNSTFAFIKILLFLVVFYYIVEIRGQSVITALIPVLFIHKGITYLFLAQERWQSFCGMIGGVRTVEIAKKALAVNQERTYGTCINGFNSSLSVDCVNVAYGEDIILKSVSINIQKNTCIGIAGPSGSGKTTILDLITGLVVPSKGNVLLDGKSYNDIDMYSLRSLFGYITQEPVVFNDTILNNITLMKFRDTEQEWKRVYQAVNMANCNELIEQAPEGYSTKVGDKGVKLSGGQRQRISIARELYLSREILIFDEATSALDTESEKSIQNSIQAMLGSKTMILVAHRLSTLKICDIIYIVEDGKIIEKGSWDELLERKGSRFSRMCENQCIIS